MVPPIYTYCTKSYVTGTDIDFDDATMYGEFHQVLKFGFARNHADASTIAAQSTNDTLMSRVWWPLNKCDLVKFSNWGNVSENFITTWEIDWEIEAEVFSYTKYGKFHQVLGDSLSTKHIERKLGRLFGGRDESERRRAESQWIVAARPLCHLQYPVAYLSRLQRILPAA